MATKNKNLVEMYMENDYRYGFHVNRDSWNGRKYAKVVAILRVDEEKSIEGVRLDFKRKNQLYLPRRSVPRIRLKAIISEINY
jgi:hypothetical protein